jgi:hypothetical protein
MTKIEKLRQKYRPYSIKYLLVAETPPKTDSKRFFYFEDVTDQDSLFIEIIKSVYPDETQNVEARTIRGNKKYFLEKFKQDGFYLIDSLESPFEEKHNGHQKVSLIKKGQNELLSKIKKLCTDQTKVILIATPGDRKNLRRNFLHF